jgi:hypothetical protein
MKLVSSYACASEPRILERDVLVFQICISSIVCFRYHRGRRNPDSDSDSGVQDGRHAMVGGVGNADAVKRRDKK